MTEQPKGPGPGLIGELQRWLVRSGARGVGREVGDQIRSAFGGAAPGDVWQTVTTEEPPGSGADCGWCPVCRAARLLRESGPSLASQVAAAGDALAGLVQDAVSIAESALASAGGPAAGPGGVPGTPPMAPRGGDGAQAPENLESPPRGPDDRG